MAMDMDREDFFGIVTFGSFLAMFFMLIVFAMMIDSRSEWQARYTEHMKTHVEIEAVAQP